MRTHHYYFSLFSFVLLNFSWAQDGGFLCEDGWILYRDQCYLYSGDVQNWYKARQICQDLGLGADLAQVRDVNVDNFLFSGHVAEVSEYYWIGLNDNAVEGFYSYLDDSFEVSYYNWFPGDPDNTTAEDAHCGQIRVSTGRWIDDDCDDVQPQICAKSVVGVTCEPGWINYKNETCVYFGTSDEARSWEASRRLCQDKGGDLITIRSPQLIVFISDVMPDTEIYYWFGLNDRAEQGYYVWLDEREKAKYLNWQTESGEPDNDKKAGSNCIAMYKNVSDPTSYGWRDVGCDDKYNYICQYPAVDINECDDNPCLYGGTCVNTHGFFYCACRTGFTGQICQTPTIYECEDDWLLKDSSCYLFEGASENWFGARVTCQGYGADLAVIRDEETNNFLKARARVIDANHSIGLNDLITEGYHVWLDESTRVVFTDWIGSNPDNVGGVGKQNCGLLDLEGLWNDRRCDRTDANNGISGGFICRKSAVNGQCENDWKYYELEEACFFYAPGSMNWHAAREQCRVLGADLADIRDELTNQFLTDNLPSSPMFYLEFWIGINDRVRANNYVWLDEDEVAGYVNWQEGQPDNEFFEAENCGAIVQVDGLWGWADTSCDEITNFICEKPADFISEEMLEKKKVEE